MILILSIEDFRDNKVDPAEPILDEDFAIPKKVIEKAEMVFYYNPVTLNVDVLKTIYGLTKTLKILKKISSATDWGDLDGL